MKFVLIVGPQAVGKMTVGQELVKLTQLKLFHNHQTIELVRELLPLDGNGWALVQELRESVFRAFARSGEAGMVYTGLWYFDDPMDAIYYNGILSLWREECPDVEIYVVELEADFDERLRRNGTENRLACKPSKRNLEWSENDLRNSQEKHRLNSAPGEIGEKNYFRLDNTSLSAADAARVICERFGWGDCVGADMFLSCAE